MFGFTNIVQGGARKKKYDIISVGDCTIDAFLKVEEATVHADVHHEHQQICFSFADKIPYESLTMLPAGNANNVSVGMARLGFKTAFYGSVGADLNGQVIMDNLKREHVDTSMMSVQKGIPTNFHVVLWFQSERTILIKHQDYVYKLPGDIANTRWMYLTSVGKKGLALHKPLAEVLAKNPGIKLSFNPGTFQLRLGLKKLAPLLKHTEILNVNKEEAELLLGRDDTAGNLAKDLIKWGPKIIVITDGMKGSYTYTGGVLRYIGVYPHHPIQNTGCGDAYATGLTAALMYDLPIEEAMRWGARNGAAVAVKMGPENGLISHKNMLADLKRHKEFKAKIIKA